MARNGASFRSTFLQYLHPRTGHTFGIPLCLSLHKQRPLLVGRHNTRLVSSTATQEVDSLTSSQLYDNFGLPVGSCRQAVKRRYFELAKEHHPDRACPSTNAVKPVDFAQLTAVYERLLSIAPLQNISEKQHAGQYFQDAGRARQYPAASAAAYAKWRRKAASPTRQAEKQTAEKPGEAQDLLRRFRQEAKESAKRARVEAAHAVSMGSSSAKSKVREARDHARSVVRGGRKTS